VEGRSGASPIGKRRKVMERKISRGGGRTGERSTTTLIRGVTFLPKHHEEEDIGKIPVPLAKKGGRRQNARPPKNRLSNSFAKSRKIAMSGIARKKGKKKDRKRRACILLRDPRRHERKQLRKNELPTCSRGRRAADSGGKAKFKSNPQMRGERKPVKRRI